MSSVDPHIYKLLRDIDISTRRIITRLDGVAREGFIDPNNLDLQDIIARRLGIIGEAAAALYKKHADFCEAHPDLLLRQARGMRNILVHDYDGIDWDIVWNTAKSPYPIFLKLLSHIYEKMTTERGCTGL